MILEITDEAKEFIEKKMDQTDKIILDYENGDSAFSNKGYSCGLDYAYRLILLSDKRKEYDLSSYTIPLKTSLGTVWMNPAGVKLLDDKIKLSFNKSYYSLGLSGSGGLITNNVNVEKRA